MNRYELTRRGALGGLLAVAAVPSAHADAALDRALAAVKDADFIAIGERHDNPAHHLLQAELVRALQPRGIAFEMVPRDKEDLLNEMRRDSASRAEIGAALEWEESGWPDWEYYAPILEAAPRAYIAGGGLSKDDIKRIYIDGAPAIGADLAAHYRLNAPLDPDIREEMLDEQFEAHCRMMPREQLGPMLEVQRAWDAAYADAWRRAAERGGGRAVLITGNAHARLDRGAPAYLRLAVPEARIAAILMTETGDHSPEDGQASAVLTAPPPERGDPCAPLRKSQSQ